eukprot:TRINITY_DN14447_c0_g1_i1.p1 TRINITY_DN14447_c0_g1~~TRINITY_DN14447_c0_g1_i1.p1  ORF type:complete len:480 (-),score=103.30 TRINITY_DN14447_c0_g1_i1:138-1556(-)
MKAIQVIVVVIICLNSSLLINGLIHHLKIRDDTRGSFFIENFGFEANGILSMNNSNIQIKGGSKNPRDYSIGFIIKRTQTNNNRFIEDNTEECLFNKKLQPFEEVIFITDWDEPWFKTYTIRPDATGFYNIYFISCEKEPLEISFDLELEMYNPGPNYLSIGNTVLPTLYALFSVLYFIVIIIWIYIYLLPKKKTNQDEVPNINPKFQSKQQVFAIHYFMTVAILLKLGAVFFHSIEMHYLKANGHAGGWEVIYIIFSIMKGIMFFVVIALIGTGWAFIKPYLSELDRKIIMIVIPLQIIANIALVIVEETAPGSIGWFTWQSIFRIVDIVCCIAVIAPIYYSVKHLKEASQTDGKVAFNVKKLQLFQQFYLIVISFIYLTRIVVYILETTLTFRWTWFSVFISEAATFSFFICTGYLFRPVFNNPYLKLEDPEDMFINNESNNYNNEEENDLVISEGKIVKSNNDQIEDHV